MRKLLLLLLLPLFAQAQNTTSLPSGTTGFTPQFRYKAITPDSLNQTWVYNPLTSKYNRFYSATEANLRFALVGSGAVYTAGYGLNLTGFQFKVDTTHTPNGLLTWDYGQRFLTIANANSNYIQNGTTVFNQNFNIGTGTGALTKVNLLPSSLPSAAASGIYVWSPNSGILAFVNGSGYNTSISSANITGSRLLRVPNTSGTIGTIDGFQTYTAATMGNFIQYQNDPGTPGVDSITVKDAATGELRTIAPNSYLTPTVANSNYWKLSGNNSAIGNQINTGTFTFTGDGTNGLYVNYGFNNGRIWANSIASKSNSNWGISLADSYSVFNAGTASGLVELSIADDPKIQITKDTTYLYNKLRLQSVATGTTANKILTVDAVTNEVKSIAGTSYKPVRTRYILWSGQSNSNGVNDDAGMADNDTTSNSKVLGWSGSAWVKLVVGISPMSLHDPFVINAGHPKAVSAAFYFAKRMQEATGDTVKVYILGWGANTINNWIPTTSTNWRFIDSVITSTIGSNKIELMGWQQGETDAGSYATYASRFNTVFSQLKNSSWTTKNVKVIIGAVTNYYPNLITVQKGIATSDSLNIFYAGMDDINGGVWQWNFNHWSAKGQQVLGDRMFSQWLNQSKYVDYAQTTLYNVPQHSAVNGLIPQYTSALNSLELNPGGGINGRNTTSYTVGMFQNSTGLTRVRAGQSTLSNQSYGVHGFFTSSYGAVGSTITYINPANIDSAGVQLPLETANHAAYIDGTKHIKTATPTLTELNYLAGVTSAIQNQLDNKQVVGNYITALTGDGSASGPGSAALTLATVNSNVGTYGDASHTNTITFDAKGRATAISSNSIQIAESQVTNLTTDLASKADVSLTPQVGITYKQTGKTTVGSGLISYTVPSDGAYRFGFNLFISAISTNTLRAKWSFTQVSGQVQTITEATASTPTSSTVVGSVARSYLVLYLKGGTVFDFSTENPVSGGSNTYDVVATLEKLP